MSPSQLAIEALIKSVDEESSLQRNIRDALLDDLQSADPSELEKTRQAFKELIADGSAPDSEGA